MELLRSDMIIDTPSRTRVLGLHPAIRQRSIDGYLGAIEALSGKNLLRVTYGRRTFAEQARLLAKRPPVTKAGPGQSYHNYGLALDFVLIHTDGKVSYSLKEDLDADGQADWREVAESFKRQGFEWGGEWNTFKDNPHVQLVPDSVLAVARQRGVRPWRVLLDRHEANQVDGEGYVVL